LNEKQKKWKSKSCMKIEKTKKNWIKMSFKCFILEIKP
jgi:hypothetical protein